MSKGNIDVIERSYEIASTAMELPQELYSEEFEMDAKDVWLETPDVIRGRSRAEAELRRYWTTFGSLQIELEEVIHADDHRVVTMIRHGGRIRGSDAEAWNRYFHVWTLDAAKIVSLSIHSERNRALGAAGLSD